MNRLVVKPRNKVVVTGYHFDNVLDLENTLTFELILVSDSSASFFWPGYAWPFRIRNKQINNFIEKGLLPRNMDLINKYGKPYNLRIEHNDCKYRGQGSSHSGFWFSPIDSPTSETKYEFAYRDSYELRWLLLNSVTQSVHGSSAFKVRVFAIILQNDRVILEDDIREKHIKAAKSFVGFTIRDDLMVSVPANLFSKTKS